MLDLTAIVTCKNRNRNAEFCISSICNCVPRPHLIVVDFGSDVPITIPKHIENKENIRIIRTVNRTKLFHKARAINIGLKHVKTKYTCITDIDQIFHPNFFGIVYSMLQKNKLLFVMCPTYFSKSIPEWLTPKTVQTHYDKMLEFSADQNIPVHGDGNCNGFLTKYALKLRGYDESYIGYGGEDSDFAYRMFQLGLIKKSIFNATSMVHLPHEKAGSYYNKERFKRNKAKFRNKFVYNKKKVDPIVNKNRAWGVI